MPSSSRSVGPSCCISCPALCSSSGGGTTVGSSSPVQTTRSAGSRTDAQWVAPSPLSGRFMPIFLFVNTKSGGQRGKRLMQVPQPFQVVVRGGIIADLRIFDMLEGSPGDKPGFTKLKEATKLSMVRMIVAGGDGTILWAIEEAERHGIDTRNQVLLAVMPLGTGNDFSRFAGWGGKAPSMSSCTKGRCQGLRDLVTLWSAAKALQHDIWKVVMEVDEHRGAILQTGKDGKKEPMERKSIEKLMHSYFSAGNDARAGMGQERSRTSTRWGNMLNYGFQICLKGMPFREKEYVKDFALSLHNGLDEDAPVIFHTDEDEDKEPRLVGNPQVLIVLNIPNCYGGFCRFWEGAGSLGVCPVLNSNLLQKDLDPADGHLEVLTYGSLLMEPVVSVTTQRLPAHRFNAKRVFSGAPMFLKFVEDDEDDVEVHVQIDGEFFKLVNPTSVGFKFHRKIKVLHGSIPNLIPEDDEDLSGDDSCTIDSASCDDEESE